MYWKKKIKSILVYTKNLLTIVKKKLQTDNAPRIKKIIVCCTSYFTLVGIPLLRKMTVRSRDQPFSVKIVTIQQIIKLMKDYKQETEINDYYY